MDSFFKEYLANIIPVSFDIKINGNEQRIGEGSPRFIVTVHKMPDKKMLLTNTSLALGEAYMRGDIEVDGDLYEVLDLFLGEMGKFKTDKNALKNLIFTPRTPKNQKDEVQSHYDISKCFLAQGKMVFTLWM